jgi:hypothetical protein
MRVPYKLGGGVLILFYFIFIFSPGWKGAAVRGAGEVRFGFGVRVSATNRRCKFPSRPLNLKMHFIKNQKNLGA